MQARVSTPSGTRLSSIKTSSWSKYVAIHADIVAHIQSHTPLDVVKGVHLIEPTPQTLCRITFKKFESVI